MRWFYKRVVASRPIHTILNNPLLQLLQNINCWKTDLNFASFISDCKPVVTIQAVMHEITAHPVYFINCTLGWNHWHSMNCQQIHLQVLTSQIRSWRGTPGTVIPKKKEICIKQKMVSAFIKYRRNKIYMCYWPSVRSKWLGIGQVPFFACLLAEQSEVHKLPIKKRHPVIFTEQTTWSIKDLLHFRGNFSWGYSG